MHGEVQAFTDACQGRDDELLQPMQPQAELVVIRCGSIHSVIP